VEIREQQFSGEEEPTLVISYVTKLELNDFEAVIKEADDFFPSLKGEAEKAGLSQILLEPATEDQGELTGVMGFSYSRTEAGQWCRIPKPFDEQPPCFD